MLKKNNLQSPGDIRKCWMIFLFLFLFLLNLQLACQGVHKKSTNNEAGNGSSLIGTTDTTTVKTIDVTTDLSVCLLPAHAACVEFQPDEYEKQVKIDRFGKLCDALGGSIINQASCADNFEEVCAIGSAGPTHALATFTFKLDQKWAARGTDADKAFISSFFCGSAPTVWSEFEDELPRASSN